MFFFVTLHTGQTITHTKQHTSMKRILSAIITLITLASPKIWAEDDFCLQMSVDELLIGGEHATLTLSMGNALPITLIQADLILPEGITVLTEEEGKADIALTSRAIAESHKALCNVLKTDNGIRLLLMSEENKTFTGNEGEVATITLSISPDIAEGDKELRLTDVLLVEPTEDSHRISEIKLKAPAIDQETAIRTINESYAQDGATYNIAGQRVIKAKNGVFIQNGKKIAARR